MVLKPLAIYAEAATIIFKNLLVLIMAKYYVISGSIMNELYKKFVSMSNLIKSNLNLITLESQGESGCI